jgi:hypothetical protein
MLLVREGYSAKLLGVYSGRQSLRVSGHLVGVVSNGKMLSRT